jgi:hypothetical protein
MKWFGRIVVAVVLIAGVGLVIYSQQPAEQPTSPATPTISESPSPEVSPTPSPSPTETLYPVPTETGEANSKLPAVDESDDTIVGDLSRLIGKASFGAIFNPKNMVRRIVVSVDNASKHAQISQEFSPFKPLEKGFQTAGKNDALTIAETNSKRYSPYVSLARTVDTEKLSKLYIHFYPLLQSAYQDLGVKGYFNDRLIAAIDVILATPEINTPIKLVRAPIHPVYKFADEKLEALPAAQKVLLRMGAENAVILKVKLRELREVFSHLDHMK